MRQMLNSFSRCLPRFCLSLTTIHPKIRLEPHDPHVLRDIFRISAGIVRFLQQHPSRKKLQIRFTG